MLIRIAIIYPENVKHMYFPKVGLSDSIEEEMLK